MRDRFTGPVLEQLRNEIEVRIETRRRADGPVHRTIIWIVVDTEGRVLARSVRGARARWYREAMSGPEVALIVGRERLPVTVERAADADRVAACSAELERKYAGDPAVRPMLVADVLETTIELRPA